jgi:2-methylisocitrate lyase-like PEP mutase family enzyme
MRNLREIEAVVKALAPKPVNALLLGPDMRVDELAGVGVRRVSVGGGLAAAAWNGFDRASRMLMEEGTVPARGR